MNAVTRATMSTRCFASMRPMNCSVWVIGSLRAAMMPTTGGPVGSACANAVEMAGGHAAESVAAATQTRSVNMPVIVMSASGGLTRFLSTNR